MMLTSLFALDCWFDNLFWWLCVAEALQPGDASVASDSWHIRAGRASIVRAVLCIDTGVNDGYFDFSLRALDIVQGVVQLIPETPCDRLGTFCIQTRVKPFRKSLER
jgi:hypothetical protein